MKDSFNRDINYLRISVTDRCNLRCFYCMPNGVETLTHDQILRDEEIIDIVTEAVKTGITKVRITGGDPLVRKGIYELIKKIKDIKGIKDVVLTTNGLLLIGHVQQLKEAGVSRVNFSLDSLQETTYQTITKHPQMLDYHALIKELIEHEMLPIKINAVLLKGINDHEVGDFINLADQYDISIRFIELMPIGEMEYQYSDLFISEQDILNRYPELQFHRKEQIATYYHVPGKQGEIGFIPAISHQFCESCNRLRLTSEGYIKACLLDDKEIFVKTKKNEALLQDIKQAITQKEERHHLDQQTSSTSKKSMNKIGG